LFGIIQPSFLKKPSWTFRHKEIKNGKKMAEMAKKNGKKKWHKEVKNGKKENWT
jgi:hypothetical protein